MNRRQFAKNTLMASAAVSHVIITGRIGNHCHPLARNLKKGIMWGSIGTGQTIMDKFQAAKAAGFDGVEVMRHLNRKKC